MVHLEIWRNKIVDITPLTGMTSLRVLQAFENKIVDISVLSGLTSLRQVTLQNNLLDCDDPATKAVLAILAAQGASISGGCP